MRRWWLIIASDLLLVIAVTAAIAFVFSFLQMRSPVFWLYLPLDFGLSVEHLDLIVWRGVGLFRVPLWMIILLSGTGAIFMLRARRRERARIGSCSACRYNLTGNTSGVCPECGTPVAENVKG